MSSASSFLHVLYQLLDEVHGGKSLMIIQSGLPRRSWWQVVCNNLPHPVALKGHNRHQLVQVMAKRMKPGANFAILSISAKEDTCYRQEEAGQESNP